MPARKAKTTKKTVSDFSDRHEVLKNPESYKSLFYGIITVVILFILGIGAVKLFLNHPRPEIDGGAVSVSRIAEAVKNTSKNSGGMYTVQESESLWDIAVKKYNDGDKWVDIARVNNLANPEIIFTGDKLMIPVLSNTPTPVQDTTLQVPSTIPEVIQAPSEIQNTMDISSAGEKISGATYTVKAGDDLWDIAVRAYGDGYKWTDIASANNLADPGLIFSDNVLKIPRQ